jgi:beta-glucoside operon transcriptional antiterminator
MVIFKIINNNIVVTKDEFHNEVILMGRGLSFEKKRGDVVDKDRVEKKFHLAKETVSDNFIELLRDMPEDIINVTHEVIELIRKTLPGKIDDRIYVTLLDHIKYAVDRYLQGIQFSDMLLVEIEHLYQAEIAVAKEALLIINQRLMVKLPEDEAAFIALHIVNAQLELDMKEVQKITAIINEVLKIIRYHFKIPLAESSLDYARLVTHLKFFARRLLRQQSYTEDDEMMFDMVKERYPDVYNCVLVVEGHVKKVYSTDLTLSEKLYLMMHLTRIKK